MWSIPGQNPLTFGLELTYQFLSGVTGRETDQTELEEIMDSLLTQDNSEGTGTTVSFESLVQVLSVLGAAQAQPDIAAGDLLMIVKNSVFSLDSHVSDSINCICCRSLHNPSLFRSSSSGHSLSRSLVLQTLYPLLFCRGCIFPLQM